MKIRCQHHIVWFRCVSAFLRVLRPASVCHNSFDSINGVVCVCVCVCTSVCVCGVYVCTSVCVCVCSVPPPSFRRSILELRSL